MPKRCEIDGMRDVYCKTHGQHWIHCTSALEAERNALKRVRDVLEALYRAHRCPEEQSCDVCDHADAILFGPEG